MNIKNSPHEESVNKDRKSLNMLEGLNTEELTRSFGYLLRRLQLLYKKNFSRIADDDFQTGQAGALILIGHNPGITPSQISIQLGMEPAQVAVVVGKLELQRLVRRASSSKDGRSRPIRLTAQGKRHFTLLQRISIEAEASFIGDALTEEETQQLGQLLSKLLASRI